MARTLVITTDWPKIQGGISRMVAGVADSIKDRAVLAPERGRDDAYDTATGYPVHHASYEFMNVGVLKTLLGIRTLRKAMRTLVDEEKADVLLCCNMLPIGWIAASRMGSRKRPYVLLTYGNDLLQPRQSFIKRKMLLAAVRGAETVIAISEFTKQAAMELGVPAERIVIIPPGIDVKAFKYDAKAANALRERSLGAKKVLLSVGRIVERKGADRVIKAMPAILKEVPSAHYVILGDGPHKPTLMQLAKDNGVADHVEFVGEVTDKDMLAYYSACDLFIMPSRYIPEKGDVEGFGIVYIEANCCGKPVIGGNVGGAKDAVIDGKTGLLVDPIDTTAIAKAVIRIFKNPVLGARLGRQGRIRAEKELDWPVIGRKLHAVLDKAAKK